MGAGGLDPKGGRLFDSDKFSITKPLFTFDYPDRNPVAGYRAGYKDNEVIDLCYTGITRHGNIRYSNDIMFHIWFRVPRVMMIFSGQEKKR